MSSYGFLVNLNLCITCRACEVACKTWNVLPTDRQIRWRRVFDESTGTWPNAVTYSVSLACNHCANAPCVKACPSKALSVRPSDGIVLIDQGKCVGCRYCAAACPYGAPQFDVALKKMSKCTFCVDRIEQGLEPACVDTCPTGALQFGKIEDLDRRGVKAIPRLADPRLSNPSIRFIPKEV